MIANFRRIISPPQFPDAKKTRSARWLNFVLWIFIFTLIAITIPLPFSSMESGLKLQFLLLQTGSMLPLLVALYLIRSGQLRLVAYFFLALVYGETIYSHVFVFQTIHEPSIIGYFVLIPLAGLLFDRRTMLGFVFLSAVTVTLTWQLEQIGVLHPLLGVASTIDDLFYILLGLALNTSLMLAILKDTEESAEDARISAAALTLTNTRAQNQPSALATGARSPGRTRGAAHPRAGPRQPGAGIRNYDPPTERATLPQLDRKLARLHLHLEHHRAGFPLLQSR